MPNRSPLILDIGQGMSIVLGASRISSWKTEDRPKKPKRGTLGFNKETSSIEYWDGTSWLAADLKEL